MLNVNSKTISKKGVLIRLGMKLFHVIILSQWIWAIPVILKIEFSMFGMEIPSIFFTAISVTGSLMFLAYFWSEYEQKLEKK